MEEYTMCVVGLDIGYGNTKLVYSHGHMREAVSIVRPSGAAPLEMLEDRADGRGKAIGNGVPVLVDGAPWVAGIESNVIKPSYTREMTDEYPASKDYRALFHAALAMIGATTVDHLVTGLPVVEYNKPGKADALQRRLQAVHHVAEDRTVEVRKVTVMPQPAGAYFEQLARWLSTPADAGAASRPEFTVLAVDPGHYSVDYVLFRQGILSTGSSDSSPLAGSAVIEEALRQIFNLTGRRLPASTIESAVRRQATILEVGARSVQLGPLYERAATKVVEQVVKGVIARLGPDRDQVNRVILAGGGAPLYLAAMRARFAEEGQVIVMPEPILANARGFWTMARPRSAQMAA
jgi:plasmid segregation protein ParM